MLVAALREMHLAELKANSQGETEDLSPTTLKKLNSANDKNGLGNKVFLDLRVRTQSRK